MKDPLDTAQWQRLGALFDQAIGLDAQGQAELLRTLESEDAVLASELASLLATDAIHNARTIEQRERVLHDAVFAIDAPGVAIGDRVGPYVLREVLGHGGMGVVFRAERVDGQVRQEVALKIVKGALLDPSGRERFLRERQIVADLQHPYIARMLDVGQTADGSPYLAMELIRGLPITASCDQRKLDIRRRVELFVRVCEAVQHAHANLVLHRDLKASNVLVGEDGLPKLIDFGIAKPLTVLVGDEHQQTTTANRFFSPSNVAPEQLRGDRVGVACDVYQLGTLLHELLCGAGVFDTSELTPGQLEQRILEVVPELPSTRAARVSLATAQAHGVDTPAALARDLRGDLDAIVAHALRKAPQERHASVEQLATDLRRYLDGQSVPAVPGQVWYPLRMVLRRHALAICAAAAVCLLAVGLTSAFWLRSPGIAHTGDPQAASQGTVTAPASGGPAIPLPASFPTDVHLPPSYSVSSVDQTSSTRIRSGTPVAKLIDEYNVAMHSAGWKGTITPGGASPSGSFEKSGRFVKVTLTAFDLPGFVLVELDDTDHLGPGADFPTNGDMPADVHLPSASRGVEGGMQMTMILMQTGSPADQLQPEYEGALVKAGWQKQNQMNLNGRTILTYSKDDHQRIVSLAFKPAGEQPCRMLLTLTVHHRPARPGAG